MLTDEAMITIKAGKGGDGSASFLREKYRPKGGPDGGDGGKGGDVYFEVDPSTHALSTFTSKKYFKAENGENGRNKKQTGKSAEDLYLKVPPGTLVKENETILADLTQLNQVYKAARGGKGGLGNVHFKSATNQAPKQTTQGGPGEEKNITLELKLLADVGLVGLPNAGKSTLLSVISNARPKIADYPFTTLEPNLGVVNFQDKSFVVADIPGLIEGASKGKGLGIKFLKHLERTRVLVHLLDINSQDLYKDYTSIRKELEVWNKELTQEKELVVLNKIDTLLPKEAEQISVKFAQKLKKPVFLISAVSKTGLEEILGEIDKLLNEY